MLEAAAAIDDFARVATDVSGQDLGWLLDEAFGKSNVFDYGVAALDSRPDGHRNV
jgi:hypothetical protein